MCEDVDEEEPLWLQPGCNIPQECLRNSRPCSLTYLELIIPFELDASPAWLATV